MRLLEEARVARRYGFNSVDDKRRGGSWQKYNIKINSDKVVHVWEAVSLGRPPFWSIALLTNNHYCQHAKKPTLEEAFNYVIDTVW